MYGPDQRFALEIKFMQNPSRHSGLLLPAIFLLGLAARVLFALVAEPELKNDESAYVEIARNVLAGKSYDSQQDLAAYGMSQVRPPFLPWLIMLIFRAAGSNILTLRVALAAFSSLVVVAAYHLARNLGATRTCALAAALLTALHPPLVVNASRVLTEAPFAVLITAACALICAWRRASSLLTVPLAGAVLGAAVLCRATVIPFLPVLAVIWMFAAEGRRRWFGLFAAATAVVLILPWEIALFREHGRVIPVSTGGGFNLWCVNNPYMKGIPGVTSPTDQMRLELARLPEAERDAYYQRNAVEWARANPRAFLKRRGECLVEFWRLVPADLRNRRYPFKDTYGVAAPPLLIVTAKLLWFSLLIATLLGSVLKAVSLFRDRRPEILSLAALVATVTLVHTIMISFSRYRIPFDPTWMTLGVLGWCDLWLRRRGRQPAGQAAS